MNFAACSLRSVRRLCAIALALILSCVQCRLPVRAEEEVSCHATAQAAVRLTKALEASAAVVDLADVALPVDALGEVYATVLQGDPALFYVAPRVSYAYSDREAGRIVTTVYPSYTLEGKELIAARALYMDTLDRVLSELHTALGGGSRSEADIALFLHDRLADRYAYDTRVSDPATAAEANSDAYRFFRDGRGICQAYALAYMALCRAAGLEADFVASPAMDHAWNHVRVDGLWYHVDVTRDDPIPAPGGEDMVMHDRFLRSDVGMETLGYYGFSCSSDHACTDTRYETVPSNGESEGNATAALLSAHRAPLVPLAGDSAVVWGGESGADPRGTVWTYRLDGGRASRLPTGDMDGDGSVTPGDLLTVMEPDFSDVWRNTVRSSLIGDDERERELYFN